MANYTFDPDGVAAARAFLHSVSDHPDRPGDTANLNPEHAVRLANAISQARDAGLKVGLGSGYRSPSQLVNSGDMSSAARWDANGNSGHAYGIASDISGLPKGDGRAFLPFAQANGLYNPYGATSANEYNHFQLYPTKAIPPQTLASLKSAAATSDFTKVWAAYPGSGGTATAYASPTPSATASAPAVQAINASAPAPGQPAAPQPSFRLPPNAPMGMGNNNPLNIKYFKGAENAYSGVIGPSANTDQGTPQIKFATPEAGWNAAYSLLKKKYDSGLTTPNTLITDHTRGWTPDYTPGAVGVAKSAGLGLNDDINFNNPAAAQKFMRAMVTQEQGGAGSAYPDAMIANAVGGKAVASPNATAVASAAPIGTTVHTTGPAAPAVNAMGGKDILPGFSTKEASDTFLKGVDKMTGGKGLGPDGQPQGQDQGPPQFQASPMIQGPGAANVSSLLAMIPMIYGQTLNSMPDSLQSAASRPPAAQASPLAGTIDAPAPQFPQYAMGMGLGGMSGFGYGGYGSYG